VHPLVTGYSKPLFGSFFTLGEAETYLEDNGVTSYKYSIKPGAGETTPQRGQKAYYAVANGRRPGIQTYY
jgi:viroplasmin and RNaseH domain-containing protein